MIVKKNLCWNSPLAWRAKCIKKINHVIDGLSWLYWYDWRHTVGVLVSRWTSLKNLLLLNV